MFSKHITRVISTFLIAAVTLVQTVTPLSFAQTRTAHAQAPNTFGAQTTHTTQFTYNVYGTLTKITYPDGTAIEYEYGGLGKIKKVKKNGVYIVTDISYGAAEEIISVSLSNGVTTTYTYNPDQLYRLTNKKTTNGALTLQNIAYTYDPVGNIIGLTDTGVGTPKQATYTYDGLNRLTSASIKDTNTGATITETYTYSKMGRILSTTARGAYQYTNTQHPYAVTQAGNITYTYDTNGNLVSSTNITTSETVTYAYDSQNRMTSFTDKNGTTKYYYGDGYARVQKVLPNGKSLTYLGELAEVDEQGKFTTYVFADKLRIATQDSTGTYYHINDHLGSANLLLDANGSVVQKIDYLPFGTERLNEKYASFETKHTFTDQKKDKESGLLYYGARYYDPALGRFTQPDPVVVDTTRKEFAQALQNPQLQNPYSYVANNPLKYIDKNGEWWETPFDVISLALSLYDFKREPSIVNGIFVGLDWAGMALPVPAIFGYIKNGTRAVKIADYFRTVSTKADDVLQMSKLFIEKVGFKFAKRGWTAGKAGNDVANMVGHFVKHGAEVGAKNVDEYYQMANKFIDEKQFTHVFEEGAEKVYYNQNTHKMVAVDANNNIKSFYEAGKDKIETFVKRITDMTRKSQ